MDILILLAHPDPASFNHALAAAAAESLRALGHEVLVQDLCAEGFDPVMPAAEFPKNATLSPDIARRCAELASADGLIVVHPNWWGQPPAILKGWIDRVVRNGVAYEFRVGPNGKPGPVPLHKLRAALVINTGNTPIDAELALYGDPLDNLWKRCFGGMCGIPRTERLYFTSVIVSTPEQRAAWLAEVRTKAATLFPRS